MTERQIINIIKKLSNSPAYIHKNDIVREIRKLEPETGQWIISSDGYYPYCSKCGYRLAQSDDLYDYCPNCGRKMNEKDD